MLKSLHQVQKLACSGRGQKCSRVVENQEGGLPNPGQACQEVPVRARHQHAGGESLQLDGVAPQ